MIEEILKHNERFVAETVDLISRHPLMPPEGVRVQGYVMDSVTGQLRTLKTISN